MLLWGRGGLPMPSYTSPRADPHSWASLPPRCSSAPPRRLVQVVRACVPVGLLLVCSCRRLLLVRPWWKNSPSRRREICRKFLKFCFEKLQSFARQNRRILARCLRKISSCQNPAKIAHTTPAANAHKFLKSFLRGNFLCKLKKFRFENSNSADFFLVVSPLSPTKNY